MSIFVYELFETMQSSVTKSKTFATKSLPASFKYCNYLLIYSKLQQNTKFHHIETLIFHVQNKSFSCNKLFIRSLSSTHRCLPRNKRKFYFHSITKNNDVYKYQSSGEYWHFFSEKQIKSYKISL